jgi:hypothetical protein
MNKQEFIRRYGQYNGSHFHKDLDALLEQKRPGVKTPKEWAEEALSRHVERGFKDPPDGCDVEDVIREALKQERETQEKRRANQPEVVCLCGSTRFREHFEKANYELTMAGKIVLSVGFYWQSGHVVHGETLGCTPEQKKGLDELHFRKIDLCDRVYVLNVGGYIGFSTRNEINYAEKVGRPVDYLESLHTSSKK